MTAEIRIADALAAIGPISAQALAHGLGLGEQTTRRVLAGMLCSGTARHVGSAKQRAGRPRTLWAAESAA